MNVLESCDGNRFISIASGVKLPLNGAKGLALVGMVLNYLMWVSSLALKSRSKHIQTKLIISSDLKDNEVGKAIYEDFPPRALAEGPYIAAPEPYVVGKGLEHLQAAIDLHQTCPLRKWSFLCNGVTTEESMVIQCEVEDLAISLPLLYEQAECLPYFSSFHGGLRIRNMIIFFLSSDTLSSTSAQGEQIWTRTSAAGRGRYTLGR